MARHTLRAATPQGRRLWRTGAACLALCLAHWALALPLSPFNFPRSASPLPPVALAYTLAPMPAGSTAESRLRVSLRVTADQPLPVLTLRMPAWTPGDYRVQNHGRHVRSVSAVTAACTATVQSAGDSSWVVDPAGASAVTVTYELPNTPPGLFSENVQVTDTQAFINGPAALMYVDGAKEKPAALTVRLPDGWKRTVTPLEPAEAGAATYDAPDYDVLVDSPVAAGDIETRDLRLRDKPHTVAFLGRHQGMAYDRAARGARTAMEACQTYMGGAAPYRRYVLFLDIGGTGGGLEHANSARIAWTRTVDAPRLTAFVAHEFMHLWNIKRIRPAALGPFDYLNPPRTRALWFYEGVTEYAARQALVQSGAVTTSEYLLELASGISELQSTSARLRVTAEESSERVWEANNSTGYGGLSYYLKGELIGLCLDLALLEATGGAAGIRTLLRDLDARCAPPRPGLNEEAIRDALIRLGGPDMGPYYDRLCRTTDELPLEQCLQTAGIMAPPGSRLRLTLDPAATDAQRQLRQAWLGLSR